jgi:tripartite-type tricarboxylate transporter receptor subunit TctC
MQWLQQKITETLEPKLPGPKSTLGYRLSLRRDTGTMRRTLIGVIAPAKTPKQAISQLAGWFTTALQVPEVQSKLVVHGLYPATSCGAEFSARIRKQYDEYGRILRELNIKAD